MCPESRYLGPWQHPFPLSQGAALGDESSQGIHRSASGSQLPGSKVLTLQCISFLISATLSLTVPTGQNFSLCDYDCRSLLGHIPGPCVGDTVSKGCISKWVRSLWVESRPPPFSPLSVISKGTFLCPPRASTHSLHSDGPHTIFFLLFGQGERSQAPH